MKVISIFIAGVISIISAYVSFTIMSSIMFVYGVIALGFEAAKPFLIHLCSVNIKADNTNKAVVTGVLAVALSCVSVFASVSALENGVNTLRTESSQYIAKSEQIERLTKLSESQRNANQITKASKTEEKIIELMAALPEAKTDTVVTRNTLPLAVGVSVLAELVVAAVLLCVPNANENTVQSVHIENMTTNIQINALVNVRESILKGETKPSFRGVSKNFKGLRREDVRTMFSEMLKAGELEPHGKGYKLSC